MMGASLVAERHHPAIFRPEAESSVLPTLRQEFSPLPRRRLTQLGSREVLDSPPDQLALVVPQNRRNARGRRYIHLFVVRDQHELARARWYRRILVRKPCVNDGQGGGADLGRWGMALPAALCRTPRREKLSDRGGSHRALSGDGD